MSWQQKLQHELKAVAIAALYFGCWIAALLILKQLILAEYQIAFHGLPLALIGALVLSKVVVVLEHVSLGEWIRAQPAWVDVILRTALYSMGVALVLVLEKGFEARHEYDGFGTAVAAIFQKTDIHHIWANTMALSGAPFGYNVLAVIRRQLGERGLRRIFLQPMSEAAGAKSDRCS